MNGDLSPLEEAYASPNDWVREQLPENSELLRLDEDLYQEESLFDEENEHDALLYYANKTDCSIPAVSGGVASHTQSDNVNSFQKERQRRTKPNGVPAATTGNGSGSGAGRTSDDKWIGYRKWYWTLLSIIESTESTYFQKMTALFEMILFLQTGWRKTCPVSQRLLVCFQVQQCKLIYAQYLEGNIEEQDEIVRDGVNFVRNTMENTSISEEVNSKQHDNAFCSDLERFSIEEALHYCDKNLLKQARLPWHRLLCSESVAASSALGDSVAPNLSETAANDGPGGSFVSARQQLHYQARQKGNNPPPPRTNANEHSSGATGKRKFVPPTRKGASTNGEDSIDAAAKSITRKSQRKAPTSSENGESGAEDDYSFLQEGEELPPELEGIEPRMIKLIINQIMDSGESVTFDDIAGLQHAKRNVIEMVVWPMKRPDLFTGLRTISKGLLLFGPPGTGKTLIGKAIAHQCEATFFSISASALTSKWIGEAEKMVRALFAVATWKQPSVIFIDEVDSLLTSRSENENESSRRIKTEFLVNLDGASTKSSDQVLVVGATNRPQELDEAARRRFVKRLYIPLPDTKGRETLVKNLLRHNANTLTEEDMQSIVRRTQGYSGSDISQLCREAAMGPVRRKLQQLDDIANVTPDMMPPIAMSDFLDAFPQIPKSVAESELTEYIKWNKEFGSVAVEQILSEEAKAETQGSTTT